MSALKNFSREVCICMDKKKLIEDILSIQPVHYDKSKNWWMWEHCFHRWKRVDEVDIINAIYKQAEINTINSKERTEFIEALKQVSRLDGFTPEPIKETMVQFDDILIDVNTGEEIKATPHLFVTNPIPWKLHEERFFQTPIIDKLFSEWVGEENIQILYEIIAYCLLPSYPIHRIFCFIGGGMNGKSCFLSLLRKFIGYENCCSTELDTLLSSRFEITRLHKKLVCQMGETNFNEMSKTSILKKLSGGDLIGYEYKNKDLLEDINYAKILIATNNLPTTTDKTIGFYRRWMIIDFPNQFSEKEDVLLKIPDEEYEALAVKSLLVLKDLLDKREFTNEGSVEDRMRKYEDHSNPLEKFLREFTEYDSAKFIFKKNFLTKLNDWCKENRFRSMSEVEIGKKMKQLGVDGGLRSDDWTGGKRYPAWIGIKFKEDDRDDRDDRAKST